MAQAKTVATVKKERYTLIRQSAVLFGNIAYRKNSFVEQKQSSNTFICNKRGRRGKLIEISVYLVFFAY